jgi:hypothetical protein
MRRLSKGMALIGALTLAGAGAPEAIAQGDVRTGTEMLRACRAFLEGQALFEHATPEEAARAGFCGGYVLGVITEETEACVPPMPAREVVSKIVEYLETHSGELDRAFDDLVERAVVATWPCKP